MESFKQKAVSFFLDVIPDKDDVDAFVETTKNAASRVAKKAREFSRIAASAAASTAIWLAGFLYRMSYAIGAKTAHRPDYELFSATVYSDDGRAVELSMRDAVEVSKFDPEDEGWSTKVREWAFGCDEVDDWHLEIRYELRGHKFRAVARPGAPFPTISKDVAPVPPKILMAYVESGDDGSKTDVTKRYLKFAGPLGDWHGTTVTAFDLFPNSDNDFYAEEGRDIVVIDNFLNTKRIAFSKDAVLSL
jgi:hypothetical protein